MKIFCVRKGKAIRLTKKYKNVLTDMVVKMFSENSEFYAGLSDDEKKELATEYVDDRESMLVFMYNTSEDIELTELSIDWS